MKVKETYIVTYEGYQTIMYRTINDEFYVTEERAYGYSFSSFVTKITNKEAINLCEDLKNELIVSLNKIKCK